MKTAVANRLFHEYFCCPIGGCTVTYRITLMIGCMFFIGIVDGCTGRKDELIDIVFCHHFEEIDCSLYIILVVEKWVMTTLPYCFECCEVYHCFDFVFLKYLVENFLIVDISLVEGNVFFGQRDECLMYAFFAV